MTVREWLQLLGVPLALVVISFLFTTQQDRRQEQTENQRAEAERKLATQRAQDEALQAYLDQMSTLLLEKNLRNSGSSEEESEVRILARARTLTVLGRLDSERNRDILQFLREAQLISGTDPVVRLNHSKLSGANLREADLSGVDLSGADLSGADLFKANLKDANLYNADLYNANLYNVDLSEADLRRANVSRGVNLNSARLSHADLHNVNMSEAKLIYANLNYTNLKDANLIEANLSHALLRHANLSHVFVRGTSLRRVSGVTNEELAQQAAELQGATMPDGQKYEDWRKDKEGSGKDVENE